MVERCLKYYYDKFDNHKCLFRADCFWDDILKQLNYLFNNYIFFKDYSKDVNDYFLEIKKLNPEEMNEKEDYKLNNLKYFMKFFEIFLTNLEKNIPPIMKIVIKIIHYSVKDKFKLDPNNYGPIITHIIFNFIISPKLQQLYKISQESQDFIHVLNRLLRVYKLYDIYFL